MDQSHLSWLMENKPLECSSKIDLLMNFDQNSNQIKTLKTLIMVVKRDLNLVIEKIQGGIDKLIEYIKNETTFL